MPYHKLLGPVVVLLFFLFVYLLLTASLGTNDKTTSSSTELANDTEVCPLKAITINDGLCDDRANIADCLFDGDDCCLEHKPKVLCSYCQCKLGDANMDSLKLLRQQDWIKVTVRKSNFHLVKKIDNVQNDLTCLHRCSSDPSSNSNSWALERFEHLNCKCYRIPPGSCPQTITNASVADDSLLELFYNKEEVCGNTSNGNVGQDPTTSTSLASTEEFQSPINNSKILIATGAFNIHMTAEIVNFNRKHVEVCDTGMKLAVEVMQAVGGLLYDRQNNPVLLICGGTFCNHFNGVDLPYEYCLDLITGGQMPFESGLLKSYSASLVINNQLWVTGGNILLIIEDSKETYFIGPDFEPILQGPDLPVPNTKHCLARHSQGERIYLLGGYTSPVSVWSIHVGDVENNVSDWKPEPFLSKGRSMSSCGVISDGIDPTIFYVVIAGTEKYDAVEEGRSTEFMKIENGYFETGPRLPYQLYRAASVALDNTLILFGGSSDEHELYTFLTSIILFQCHHGDCQVTLQNQQLNHRRNSFVATLIPDDLIECSNN